jgi:thymidylate synthase ThyX
VNIQEAHTKEITFHIPEGYDSIEKWLESIGRTCYKSEDKITEESAPRFIRMLRKRGHNAMIEHAFATARIIGDRGLCYDDQTEVLTYDGWKLFKDTSKNDLFFTLNMDTKETEYQKKTKTIVEDWDGELICGKSSMVDFAVTPNHRMVWFHYDARKKGWKINKAEEVYDRRVKFQRGLFKSFIGKLPSSDIIENIGMLDFARFMGLFITDGNIWKGKNTGGRISISQTKIYGRKYIREVLERLPWNYKENENGFRINNTKLYNFLRSYFPGRKTYTGGIPEWIRHATPEYIKAFLEGAIVGDGNIHKTNNHVVIYSGNYQMAGDFQELFMKVGLCSSVRKDDRRGQERMMANGNIIKNKVIGYIVSVTQRTNEHLFNRKHWSKKHYNGKVYCVSVPNGTLYVRRNGKAFWSGNSHELVRHRLASYAQESTRYCNYTKGKFGEEISVILQPGLNQDQQDAWETAILDSEKHYFNLVKMGVKPEMARSVLPIGLKAEIVITTNLREWMWIFEMRSSKYAHPIIRKVSIEILDKFNDRLPSIYEKIAEKYL